MTSPSYLPSRSFPQPPPSSQTNGQTSDAFLGRTSHGRKLKTNTSMRSSTATVANIWPHRTYIFFYILPMLLATLSLPADHNSSYAYQFKFRRRQSVVTSSSSSSSLSLSPPATSISAAFPIDTGGGRWSSSSSKIASSSSTDDGEEGSSSASTHDFAPGDAPASTATKLSPKVWIQQLKLGYGRRVAADPSFRSKSITEVILAATTQLMAEWNRRGTDRLLPEFDFIFPAILAAVFGKYYSMWRVAKTLDGSVSSTHNDNKKEGRKEEPSSLSSSSKDMILFGRMRVPTNAFQPHLLDGATKPTLVQRLGSFVAPVGPLFRAGIISSAVGYGIGAVLVQARSVLVSDFVPVTVQINILHACIYTGCFMAVVSNIRYQILQGLFEPFIDKVFANVPWIRSGLTFVIRYLNGLLGSILAISGMRFFGLQKLK